MVLGYQSLINNRYQVRIFMYKIQKNVITFEN